MSGVAPTPVVVDAEHLADLEPPGDFRGSSTYRAELAQVLLGRVLEQLS
jgi:CO/xanthine dehydrogenase FAD-binding subunit